MQKASTLEDSEFEQSINKDREKISELIVENRGLRELLEISRKYGSASSPSALNNNGSETNKISVETQTDSNANKC